MRIYIYTFYPITIYQTNNAAINITDFSNTKSVSIFFYLCSF